MAVKNTPLVIKFYEDNAFSADFKEKITTNLQKKILQDGWWKLKSESDKDYYEISVKTFKRDAHVKSEKIEEKEDKTMRTLEYSADGMSEFSLKKSGEKEARALTAVAAIDDISERELPKLPGRSSLRPFFTLLTGGMSERQEAIVGQDAELRARILESLNANLSSEILAKITPMKRIARVAMEKSDDMEAVEKFVDHEDYQSAFHYLNTLKERSPRGDVFYNLAVIQEARGFFGEACSLYQKAYDMESKPIYLEQKSACETRLSEMTKIGNTL